MTKRLLWVDIGMAIVLGGFIAVLIFLRDASFFVPAMLIYTVGIVIWALIAEVAAVRAETSEAELNQAARTTSTPLPH